MARKVQVWVYRRAPTVQLLVLQRPSSLGSLWAPITGGVRPEERLASAARRELVEETGLRGKGPLRALRHRFSFRRGHRQIRESVYCVEAEKGRIRLSREHVQYRWASPDEALRLLPYESQREAVRRLLRRLSRA